MCNGGVLVWIHVSLRFCLVDTFCTGFFVVFFLAESAGLKWNGFVVCTVGL